MSIFFVFIMGCEDSSKSLFNQEVSSEEKFTVDKDFLIMDNLLLELTPEDVKELLGEPEQISEDKEYYTDMFDDNDRLVYEYSGFIIDFVGDIEEENFSFYYLKIIDDKINGPRGIRIDQTYEEVIDNFKIDSSMENNTLYEEEQVDNIWISGRVYLDEAKEYVEQVVYIDIYEEQKANLVLNFNEQEKVEEIFLSKDPTW